MRQTDNQRKDTLEQFDRVTPLHHNCLLLTDQWVYLIQR